MIDNYDLWTLHDAEQQKRLAKLPVCCMCGEPIQDEYYFEIEDEIYCEKCLREYCRRETDEYAES